MWRIVCGNADVAACAETAASTFAANSSGVTKKFVPCAFTIRSRKAATRPALSGVLNASMYSGRQGASLLSRKTSRVPSLAASYSSCVIEAPDGFASVGTKPKRHAKMPT